VGVGLEEDEIMKLAILMVMAGAAFAQSQVLERAMREAESAWNRGDLPAFAAWYEDAPTTTFIGREVTRGGVQAILDRYRRGYGSPEKMGTLTYSEMEVRPLGKDYALMLGRFALKRSAAGGGDSSGRFTLVWKKTRAGWRIIHDHTS
jgi:uncharacterized protein (TIGR02246 family)